MNRAYFGTGFHKTDSKVNRHEYKTISRGDKMRELELAVGRYVEFHHCGFRLGRIARIRGNRLTVVLSPYMLRGRRKGKKVRIEKTAVTGIVRGKEVIPWRYTS